MDNTPHPVVLGIAFWWVYDCNLEGRNKTLSMVVPPGTLLLQHCPQRVLTARPDIADNPLAVTTRQFLRDSEDMFCFETRIFQLRGDEVPELEV